MNSIDGPSLHNKLPTAPYGFKIYDSKRWYNHKGRLILEGIQDLVGPDICVSAICFMMTERKCSVAWESNHIACYQNMSLFEYGPEKLSSFITVSLRNL